MINKPINHITTGRCAWEHVSHVWDRSNPHDPLCPRQFLVGATAYRFHPGQRFTPRVQQSSASTHNNDRWTSHSQPQTPTFVTLFPRSDNTYNVLIDNCITRGVTLLASTKKLNAFLSPPISCKERYATGDVDSTVFICSLHVVTLFLFREITLHLVLRNVFFFLNIPKIRQEQTFPSPTKIQISDFPLPPLCFQHGHRRYIYISHPQFDLFWK